jgi:gamma-glutamyltranspeptidase / glutathione hydrolase
MRAIFLSLILVLSCSHKVRIVAPTPVLTRETHEATSNQAMVTSQGPGTTRAALEILKSSGNIIDAFVAASFAISVERPHSTGLGGGGFLMYYSKADQQVYALDFREVAPLKSFAKMYLDKKGDTQPLLSQEGSLAVATPGLVRGLYEIHSKWGRLSWAETIAPAITLARDGFPLYEELEMAIRERKSVLMRDPEATRTFYLANGDVPAVGSILKQENLAKTLEFIAQTGADGFYQGKIAQAIIKTVKSKKGILTQKDFDQYQMVERLPVKGSFKGLDIFSMPPPSSGGIHVIQILKMLEPWNLKSYGPQSAKAVHLTAQSMQRAFVDRANYLGDPDFHAVPTKELLDDRYLKQLSETLTLDQMPKMDQLRPIALPYESTDTTHFSIADKEGNLIASTQTINGWFGSGVMAQGTGIVLNNEMDDFAQKVGAQNLFKAVGGTNNLVQPRKRPLSSMSPTIILKKNEPYMALGSPSGTRIITCVAQTILNSVEYEMPLYESVAATRIHQQWQPDELKIESPFLSEKVEKELTQKGHKIVHGRLGCSIQAIQKQKKGWRGVSDPRGAGLAQGL